MEINSSLSLSVKSPFSTKLRVSLAISSAGFIAKATPVKSVFRRISVTNYHPFNIVSCSVSTDKVVLQLRGLLHQPNG